MKNKFFLFALLIIILQSFTLYAQDNNQILLKQQLCKDFEKADVVVLYDSTIVDVMETGLSHVYLHKLIKVQSDNGALQNRMIKYDYEPLSAFVKIISAKIYRKNGSIEVLDTSRFIDIAAPARMIYWGARQLVIDVGFLEPGDAVETIVYRKGFAYALLQNTNDDDDRFIPPMRGHFYDIVEFWSTMPVAEKVYKLYLPQTKNLQYEFYNGEATMFSHFPTKQKIENVYVVPDKKMKANNAPFDNYVHPGDKKIYCWTKRNILPIKQERNMVALSDVAPKLLLSTTKTWYEKAIWFHKVNEDYGSFEVTPAIKQKTDALLKGVNDEMEKISILTHWVAEEIRYSGISMGEGEGYTLHKGSMTFADRCGVCKDKAGMLITMLRAAGFESYAAMTMAGSRIDRIPADQFNHSVTVVKLKSGEWMLLDPTWVPGVRELWSSAEQQQGFLMGIPGGSDIMYTPISPAENHYWKLKIKISFDKSGDAVSEIILEAEGQSDAMLRRALGGYLSSQKNYLPQLVHRAYPQAVILESSFSSPVDLSKPMTIKLKIKIPGFANVQDNIIYFTPVVAKNIFSDGFNAAELYIDTSLAQRQYGFLARCSKFIELEENIVLPEKYNWVNEYKFKDINAESARFNADVKINGNELNIKCSHVLPKRVYEVGDWNDFKAALQERHKFHELSIVLKKS